MKVPAYALEITCYFTWKGEDGIVRTQVKPGSEVGLKEARENSDAVNGLSVNGEKFPLIVDARGIKSMTRDARNQFTTKGRETSVTSFAIIIDSPLSRVIGNFFMGINKPAVPTRLFENEEDAKAWLLSLNVNKSEN